MDTRTVSEYYAEIGAQLIKDEPALKHLASSQVTILYLSSAHKKRGAGSIIFGQCEKVPDKYKWAVPCDFTITIFEPNVADFTEEQLKALIFHELLHVGIEKDGDDEHYSIKPHDLEDFRMIIDRYGVDWNR